MRVFQVFNLPSHQVLPLARCLANLVGESNFRYGAVYYPFMNDRQTLGWNMKENDPWILRQGENETETRLFEQWWDEADVVLCGERLFARMRDRLENKKLTFHMTERWWKPPIGMARLLHPRFARMTMNFRQLETSPLFHFQAIGGYAASDIKRIAQFSGRLWNWGYFATMSDPLPPCERTSEGKGFRVLWVGRMLGWKRVDTLIRAFPRLLTERADATLTLVGNGPEENRLKRLAADLLPAGACSFLPGTPTAEVMRMMRQSHVYVLPSTGGEGWGIVLNEAMGEGCAAIANRRAGGAKSMIRHRGNGLLFDTGDYKGLGDLLCELGRDEQLRLRLAEEGQKSIANCWSPAVAAERFLSVCESLLAKKPLPSFKDGPMSPAWD